MKRIASLFFGFVLCAGAAAPVAAQLTLPAGQDRSAMRLHLGYQSGYTRAEVAYETPSLWQTSVFGHPFDVKLETGFAYWHANDDTTKSHSRDNLWQISAIPMLRWWLGDTWYMEAGIGVTLMSHTRFDDREISTRLQFGDHIGIAKTLGQDWRIGLRLSHWSNASIKRPNPGLELVQITLSRSF